MSETEHEVLEGETDAPDVEVDETGERRIGDHLESLGVNVHDRGAVRARAEELLPDFKARYGNSFETGIKALDRAVDELEVKPTPLEGYEAIISRHTARFQRADKAE